MGHASKMVEVLLKQPDDFLKVRETLTRISVASAVIRNYINLVIFYTNKDIITLSTLKNSFS